MSIMLVSAHSATENRALIIGDIDNPAYTRLITATKTSLSNVSIHSTVIAAEDTFSLNSDQYQILITVGKKALLQTIASLKNRKSISILPGNNDLNSIPDNIINNKKHAFIFMTHGICRQLKLARTLNKSWKKALFISSNNTDALNREAASCNIDTPKAVIRKISSNSNLVQTLNGNLKQNDILIALPDPAIYNSKTIKSILLTTYRQRVPVIGFSENMVKAGALVSLHSNFKDIAEDTALLTQESLLNEQFTNRFNYPKSYSIVSNDAVARSLGINTLNNKILHTKFTNEINSHE